MANHFRAIRSFAKLVIFALILGYGASHAAGCHWLHEIQFADGEKACVTDYPISSMVPLGFRQSLKELMIRTSTAPINTYAVAISVGPASCPLAIGYSPPLANAAVESIIGSAVASCNQSLANMSPGRNEACGCMPLVMNGMSKLTKTVFESRNAVNAKDVSQTAQKPVEKPSTVPSAAPPSQSAGEVSALSKSEVEELRAQLQQMRAQAEMSKQKSEPTPQNMQSIAKPPSASVMPASSTNRITAQALIIGNSAYTAFGKLPNPRNDARAIAAKLRSFGIDVDLVLDADRGALVNALNQYQSKAVGKDVNILYYAGHGVQVNGINYLVPTDMRADGVTAGYIKLNGVSLNDALDYLPAKTKLVFLDACRDNPASRSLVASRSAGAVGLASVNTATGTLIAYATKEGATADDGNGANSPYTTALLENLDAQLDISIVLRKVRQRVMALTSGRQEPWEYGSLMGDQLILSTMAK